MSTLQSLLGLSFPHQKAKVAETASKLSHSQHFCQLSCSSSGAGEARGSEVATGCPDGWRQYVLAGK